MDKSIKVTIICITYNHQDYIEDALKGFLMQKTNFKYEIIVHDDASTDKTAEIIKKYEKKYPEMIRPIYQKENQYSKRVSIMKEYIFPKVKGKYIATCEGDDYWIDPLKLQKQVDYMEQHPECSACYGSTKIVDAKTNEILGDIKIKEDSTYLNMEECVLKYLPQTSTFLAKTSVMLQKPDFMYKTPVGDVMNLNWVAINGKVYYFSDYFSYYRSEVPGSWTMRMEKDEKMKNEHRVQMKKAFIQLDEYTDYKYHELLKIKISEYDIGDLKRRKQIIKLLKNDRFRYSSTRTQIVWILEALVPNIIQLYRKFKYKERK